MPFIEAKPRAFYVVLERNQAVFYAGQQIRGMVVLDLPEEKKTRGVYITLTGLVRTHFEPTCCECCECCSVCGCETRPATQVNMSAKHRADSAEFYKLKLALFEPPKGTDKMPPGVYNFPFAFNIAPEMDWPSTFRSNSGDITYQLKAIVDRPWKFDHKTYLGVTILPMLDANAPMFLQPQNKDQERTVSCFGSDYVLAKVSLPRKAFAPGEILQTMVTIENHGKAAVRGFDVALVQFANYFIAGNQKEHAFTRNTLAHTSCGLRVTQEQTSQPTEVTFQVPAACPSIRLGAAKLLEVNYVVEVTVLSKKKLRIRVPVEIATVPYAPPMAMAAGAGPAAAATAAPVVCPWTTPQAVMDHAAQMLLPSAPPPPQYDDIYANHEPEPAQYLPAFSYPVYAPSAPPMGAPSMAAAGVGMAPQMSMPGAMPQQPPQGYALPSAPMPPPQQQQQQQFPQGPALPQSYAAPSAPMPQYVDAKPV